MLHSEQPRVSGRQAPNDKGREGAVPAGRRGISNGAALLRQLGQ